MNQRNSTTITTFTTTPHSDCDICFLPKQKKESYSLSCCRNNTICNQCISKMILSTCPFCRQQLPLVKEKDNEPISFLDEHIDMDEICCLNNISKNYYSRLYRKRRTRMLKLKDSQRIRLENEISRKQRIQSYLENKKKNLNHFRIQSEIEENS